MFSIVIGARQMTFYYVVDYFLVTGSCLETFEGSSAS